MIHRRRKGRFVSERIDDSIWRDKRREFYGSTAKGTPDNGNASTGLVLGKSKAVHPVSCTPVNAPSRLRRQPRVLPSDPRQTPFAKTPVGGDVWMPKTGTVIGPNEWVARVMSITGTGRSASIV